jgi:hypothetical protein
MMEQDLRKFCSGWNANIQRPWSRGDFTYATNGKIIVRTPRLDNVPDHEFAPDAARLKWDNHAHAFPIPDLPDPLVEACPDCCGDEDYMPGCEECSGSGNVLVWGHTDIGGMRYDNEYLALIKGLPGYQFCPVQYDWSKGNRPDPSPFTFDGGDGLLMPVKE